MAQIVAQIVISINKNTTYINTYVYIFGFSALSQINFSIASTNEGGGNCHGRSHSWLRGASGGGILVSGSGPTGGSSVIPAARGGRLVGHWGPGGALSGRLCHIECDHADRHTRLFALSGKSSSLIGFTAAASYFVRISIICGLLYLIFIMYCMFFLGLRARELRACFYL